jgi:hypothetical protein
MAEVRIMTQTPGLVLFDPVQLHQFLTSNQVGGPNVLSSFQHDPPLGQAALSTGCLLPVYSIPAWDYLVRVTLGTRPTVPAEWLLWQVPGFVLHVGSGRVLVADIWALLNWEADTYLHLGREQPSADVAATEFSTTAAVVVPNGQYQVTLVGFCDLDDPQLDTRACGYEVLLTRHDQAVWGLSGSIDDLALDVVRLPE